MSDHVIRNMHLVRHEVSKLLADVQKLEGRLLDGHGEVKTKLTISAQMQGSRDKRIHERLDGIIAKLDKLIDK